MPQTLYEKLWQDHLVHQQADGTALIYIDRHLVHEVTSPQAFEGLKLAGRKPWRVSSIVATADHNTPTDHWDRGIEDPISRLQVETLDANIRAVGALAYFPFRDPRQGIVHVVGPESGATLPGMTVVCGIRIPARTALSRAWHTASAPPRSNMFWPRSACCRSSRKPCSCRWMGGSPGE
jgi:3-isopropylmalate/(R)-2-methylmalate dehydratase large subunit